MYARLIGAVVFTVWSTTAAAQDDEGVLDFGSVDIKAQADAPKVELLIVRENLKMKYELSLEESFLPRIWKSVENKPF